MRNFVIVALCACAAGWFTFTRLVAMPPGTLMRVALAEKPIPIQGGRLDTYTLVRERGWG